MKPLKFPLITITCFFIVGIIVQYYLKFSISILLEICLLVLIVLGFSYWSSNKKIIQNSTFGLVTYVLALALGMLTFYAHAEKNKQSHYLKHGIENTNSVRAIVATSLKPNTKYNKYFIQLKTLNDKTVTGKILLYASKSNHIKLKAGDEIFLNSNIYPIPKAFNPYQFDYAKYLEKQNVFHQIFIKKNQFKVIQTHANFDYKIEQLRTNLSDSFNMHHFDSKTKAIIDALLLGQRVDLDKETVADYSNAGVIHILAISGLHISIIYFFIVFLLKPLKRIRFGKEIELVIVLTILWLFAFLTGLPASVTRAVTLFSFVSVGKYFNQAKAIYNAIAISALLILLFRPNAIFDIGFQLSYAAVLSIVLFQPFFKKCYFSKNKIAVYFTDIVLVSLASQIGVLPLSLYYFNQLPMLFLLANLIIIPLSTVVLIGGIILLIFNFIFADLALFLGKIIGSIINFMNLYIHWIAQFKNGIITNISFSSALTIMLYLFIICCIYWLYHLKSKNFKYALLSLFAFQMSYFAIKFTENNSSELIILNSRSSTIAIKNKNEILAFTDNPEINTEALHHYKRGTFSDSLRIFPLQNVLSFENNKILIVDSIGIYKTSIPAEIIVLSQNPKINLNRLIQDVKPKIIIADKTNYKNTVKIWEATCRKEKIPFHAIAEKGFYRLQ